MKKRILAMLLACSLIAGLTACGASPAPSDSSMPESTSETGTNSEKTAAKFDDVKLKLLSCWNGGFKTAADQYNNDVAKALREKTGVTVEFEGIMMSEVEKLNLIFASGDMPDMINAPYWGGSSGETAVIKKAGREGRLIDLKEEIKKYPNLAGAYDLGVVSQKYLENDIDDPSFNGARYVLPTQTPSGSVESITNWTYGVFVRGDVPKALGIDETKIKTTDELYKFMKAAKEHGFKDVNGNDTIVATTYHEGWDYSGYQQNFSSKTVNAPYAVLDDGTVTYDALTENWVNKNLFIWKLVNEGLLDKECFKHSDAQADEKVGNGTALFASAQYGPIVNSTKLTGLYDSNPEMRYTWVGPLNYADGQAAVQTETEGRSGSPAMIFPTTCTNLDAALTWLDYVNSEEGARLCQYGFEGDTYEMKDGQPRMNAELTKRYGTDSESVRTELRDRGIGYVLSPTLLADKRMEWWGENDAFQADAENPMIKEYKTIRPVEIIKGYPISGLAASYEKYSEVSEFAFEGTTEKDYRERAYFAATEDEARQILKDYQTYLTTQKSGLFNDFLKYMKEAVAARDDIAKD
ncbi:hypothetical protein [Hominenteromicrobium sp.]|uniref:hypothetical protein n=1 Tax=Hominenteromicrobium sp. TaxID=3073581 RepID=UPI003AB798EC